MNGGSRSRAIAMVCAGFLFVFGFKFLGMERAAWMMTPAPLRGDAPGVAGQTPRTGGAAVYPPPDFVPPQSSSARPRGLYPFIGRVPMESVGAGIALLAIAGGVTAAAWLGVFVLVVFSAGHTVVDWVAISALSAALVACHLSAAIRPQRS